jgi:hypothetical protein
MMLLGRRVTRAGELHQALQACGFADVRGFDSDRFPMAPVHVLAARKAYA